KSADRTMKHKSIIPILIPILLTLFFLSLPMRINSTLRDRGGLYFSAFWRLIHSQFEKQVSREKKEAFASFLTQDVRATEMYNKKGQTVLKELTNHTQAYTQTGAQKILIGRVV